MGELKVLFLSEVDFEVLVALDEALRIDLPVADLLASISLDAFKERRKSFLLLHSQPCLLASHAIADHGCTACELPFFQVIASFLDSPSLFVLAQFCKCLLLPPQFQQLAGKLASFRSASKLLLEHCELASMLLLQAFKTHVRCGLIVGHVLIPRGGKAEELLLLGLLDLVHFMVLGLLDQLLLALLLLLAKLFVLPSSLLRLHVL